ncbi:MAG: ABC transporter substrate-binding protein [Candidatus Promineifilaceae bacterium]|nr:ABC transporter substrate-binding protein [Candidatus Promineifilaceae bacterium]
MRSHDSYRKKNRVLLLLLVGLLLLPATGCQRVAPVVKVGLVAPFEGRHRAVGYDVLYSARLAVREINNAGGINGTRVALVALDDGGNPEFAESTAHSLVIDPGVVAVIGHWLPETTRAAETIYEDEALLFIRGGLPPFGETDPEQLPDDFITAYAEVSPFDEMPGPYAGSAYEAFQDLFVVIAAAQENSGLINRAALQEASRNLEH